MIVKNPTGSTINYLFASLILGPGQSGEIDNSYIENLEFQKALSNNTISVLKYEKDFVSNTVILSIGVPPTNPNIDQKGALVASNQPSCLNPFMTQKDYIIDNVHLDYSLEDTISLTGSFLSIKGKLTSINSITYNTISDYMIDASGNNMGVPFTANSIGYLYVNQAGLLRPSLVAPTIIEYYFDKYLINDWKYIGMFKTNNLGLLDNALNVYSHYRKVPKYVQINDLSGVVHSAGPNLFNTLHTEKILTNGAVKVHCSFAIETTNPGEELNYAINQYLFASSIGSSRMSGFNYSYHNVVEEISIMVQMQGSTAEHSCDLSTINLIIEGLQ